MLCLAPWNAWPNCRCSGVKSETLAYHRGWHSELTWDSAKFATFGSPPAIFACPSPPNAKAKTKSGTTNAVRRQGTQNKTTGKTREKQKRKSKRHTVAKTRDQQPASKPQTRGEADRETITCLDVLSHVNDRTRSGSARHPRVSTGRLSCPEPCLGR